MKNLKSALLYITLATMPLVEVFFINLGIPVKIYQISLILLIGIFLFDSNTSPIKIPVEFIWVGVTFLLISTLSAILGWFELSQIGGWPFWANGTRMTPTSFIIELVYLVMNFIFFGIVAKQAAQEKEVMKRLIFWTACGAILPALLAINQLYGVIGGEPILILEKANEREDVVQDLVPRFSSSFQEPNHYAAYLSVVIPLMIGSLGIYGKDDIRKGVIAVSLLLSFIGLLLSRSTIGLFSIAVVTIYFFARKGIKNLLFGVGFIFLTSILVLFQSGDLKFLFELEFESTVAKLQGSTGSFEARLKEIEYAFELFLRHPLLGVGLSHYGLYCAVILGLNESIKLSINNVYLYILSQTGILGFVCFGFFIYLLQKPLMYFRNLSSEERNQMNIIFSSLLLSMMLIFFAASSPLSPYFWAAFGLLAGWGISEKEGLKQSQPETFL